MVGSTEHEALSVPYKRIGYYWVIWYVLPSSLYILYRCIRSTLQQRVLLPRWPKITENYFTIQQFWSFRQGQSKVEGLVLFECVQTVVEKPIKKIWDGESVSPTFYFTLYSTDLASPHAAQGTYMARCLKKVIIIIILNNLLPWGGNRWIIVKKEHNHNNGITALWLFLQVAWDSLRLSRHGQYT